MTCQGVLTTILLLLDNLVTNHFVIQEIVSHDNDLRKRMNFTHDLLRKNTYNVSLLFYVTKPNGNNNAFTTSILLHSICTINFGRREQFQSCVVFQILYIALADNHYQFACKRFARQEVTTLSIFSSQLLLYIAFNLFSNDCLIWCHLILIRQRHCNCWR